MNSQEKEVARLLLESEQEALEEVKRYYHEAYERVCERIEALQSSNWESAQAKIYQIQHQQDLANQLEKIMNDLDTKSISTIEGYLMYVAETSYLGVGYSLAAQGIGFYTPIDQAALWQMALRSYDDIKVSQRLYDDVEKLQVVVRQEISRGIASGQSYADIARNIDRRFDATLYQANRIAITEGHRVREAAAQEAAQDALSTGADLVKQWDSTLDSRTRPTHQALDGQIREIAEPYEVSGYQAMHPGGFGIASEDINCRCASMVRSRTVAEGERYQSKWDNEHGVQVSYRSFDDYKQRYLSLSSIEGSVEYEDFEATEDKERRAYDVLKEHGYRILVKAVDPEARRQNITSPDALLEGFLWEMKCPDGGTYNTVDKNIGKAISQLKRAGVTESRVLISNIETSIEDGVFVGYAERSFAARKLTDLILILKDGTVLRLKD